MGSGTHFHARKRTFFLDETKKKKLWYMCFSGKKTHRWNWTCSSLVSFSEWKVFRRERTTSPRSTIYCPSLGIPHDPGMGMESGKIWNSELALAVLSWLSDKTLSAAPKLCTKVFSKRHFSCFSFVLIKITKALPLTRPAKVQGGCSFSF